MFSRGSARPGSAIDTKSWGKRRGAWLATTPAAGSTIAPGAPLWAATQGSRPLQAAAPSAATGLFLQRIARSETSSRNTNVLGVPS